LMVSPTRTETRAGTKRRLLMLISTVVAPGTGRVAAGRTSGASVGVRPDGVRWLPEDPGFQTNQAAPATKISRITTSRILLFIEIYSKLNFNVTGKKSSKNYQRENEHRQPKHDLGC
jgi:hypothetical protein